MMKLTSKSMSSPGRAEKYPPPLMRFMRSNGGSRSRRSRSSPMFVRKKNTAIETQEPSSPKVTCMGQVRVRRSKQSKTRPVKHRNRWCSCIRSTMFCRDLMGKKLKVKSCRPAAWRKWVLFFRAGFKRKSKIREDPLKIEPQFGNPSREMQHESEEEEEEEEDEEEEVEEDAKVYVSTDFTPPKNALLLTRCRSAPYRSSSLACRFWGSPLTSDETEQKQSTDQESREEESVSDESIKGTTTTRLDQEDEEKLGFIKEVEPSISSTKETILKPDKIEEHRTGGGGGEDGGAAGPLILTRCKSEPARTGEKLDPEMIYWRKGRLGLT